MSRASRKAGPIRLRRVREAEKPKPFRPSVCNPYPGVCVTDLLAYDDEIGDYVLVGREYEVEP